MFSQIDVYLGEKVVTTANNNYGYRAYLESLLSTSYIQQTTYMTAGGWDQEIIGSDDPVDKRVGFIHPGKQVELLTRLHLDVSQQTRLLPAKIPVKIVLTPIKKEFYLLVRDGFTLKHEFQS